MGGCWCADEVVTRSIDALSLSACLLALSLTLALSREHALAEVEVSGLVALVQLVRSHQLRRHLSTRHGFGRWFGWE